MNSPDKTAKISTASFDGDRTERIDPSGGTVALESSGAPATGTAEGVPLSSLYAIQSKIGGGGMGVVYLAKDLKDTLAAHRTECVGMAANMIGVLKRAIVFDDEGRAPVMFNPEIISSSDPYETEEGCLSLSGTRKTKRFRIIKVRFRDESFRVRERVLVGWTAQIVQHEIDHCSGILI